MLASVFFGSGEAGTCASSSAVLGGSLAAAEHEARTWASGVAILGGAIATTVNTVEHGFHFPLAESCGGIKFASSCHEIERRRWCLPVLSMLMAYILAPFFLLLTGVRHDGACRPGSMT